MFLRLSFAKLFPIFLPKQNRFFQIWQPWNPRPEFAPASSLRSSSRFHAEKVLETDQGRGQGHPEQAFGRDARGPAEVGATITKKCLKTEMREKDKYETLIY